MLFFNAEETLAYPTEVIENFLYLGSIDTLQRGGSDFDSIISVMKGAPSTSKRQLIIPLADSVDAKITPYFTDVFHVLMDAQAKKEKVLIHCEKGISRSASFVIAWLLREAFNRGEFVDYRKTLAELVSQRAVVSPNSGFAAELRLYAQQLNEQSKLNKSDIYSSDSNCRI